MSKYEGIKFSASWVSQKWVKSNREKEGRKRKKSVKTIASFVTTEAACIVKPILMGYPGFGLCFPMEWQQQQQQSQPYQNLTCVLCVCKVRVKVKLCVCIKSKCVCVKSKSNCVCVCKFRVKVCVCVKSKSNSVCVKSESKSKSGFDLGAAPTCFPEHVPGLARYVLSAQLSLVQVNWMNIGPAGQISCCSGTLGRLLC